MRKTAHVPIQTWKGWNLNNVWRLVLCLRQIQDPDRSMFNSALLGSLGIVVDWDHYGGHYRKENTCPCNNDAVEIQTLNQDNAL
jgi:hypothetical protein